MDVNSRNVLNTVFILWQMFIISWSDTSPCDQCAQDPTKCRQVSGTYSVTGLGRGYHPIIEIPVGACNINITELGKSSNFLALKTTSGVSIINGLWSLVSPGVYRGAAAAFIYGRTEPYCPGECIRGQGPTNESIIAQILYYDRNPGIEYSYQLPSYVEQPLSAVPVIEEHHRKHHHRHHSRKHRHRQELTTSEREEIEAIKRGDNFDILDKGDNPLAESDRTKESGSLEYDREYQDGSYRGSRRRFPIYTSEFRRGRIRQIPSPVYVNPYGSQYQALTDRTYSRQSTGGRSETGRPEYTSGLDRSINEIEYELGSTEQGQVVTGSDEYSWRVSGFTECSKTCGGGMQETIVVCVLTTNLDVVDDSNCNTAIKPLRQDVVCNNNQCPADWEEGDWSFCSVTCGNGQITRRVECKQRLSATLTITVPDDNCSGPRPVRVQECQRPACTAWAIGDWSSCSAECGFGQRRRQIQCRDAAGRVISDHHCDPPKPRTEESCDAGSCTRHWFFSSWSNTCSSDCGSGTMSRNVHCGSDTGQILAEDNCEISKKPEALKSCQSDIPCGGKWFTGPWSGCSTSCGDGVKSRSVVCIRRISGQVMSVVSEDNCPSAQKPSSEEPCGQDSCGVQWYMSEWTQCSVTCGGGKKWRYVKCLDQNQQPSSACTESEKPGTSQSCNEDRCWTRPTGSPECTDQFPNCRIAVQARLCRYGYYQRKCCLSCSHGL